MSTAAGAIDVACRRSIMRCRPLRLGEVFVSEGLLEWGVGGESVLNFGLELR